MRKFKIMISQPMRGKSEEQIRSERAQIVKKIEEKGYEIVDTIFAKESPEDCNNAIWYLAKSIDVISKVDAVMFMDGWQNARGCKIEHEICLQYGRTIMYEHELYIGVKNECKC